MGHLDRMVYGGLKNRKRDMEVKGGNLGYKLLKERESLYVTVVDALEKAVLKRRKEFQRLWVKYVKVSRTIEGLQHQENCRLQDLESKIFKAIFFEKFIRAFF